MPRGSGTVVVAGSIAQRPQRPGHAWVFLQYLLGFRRLGWDVLFLDRLTSQMSAGSDGNGEGPESWAVHTEWLERMMAHAGLEAAYSLELPDRSRLGLDRATVERMVRRADLLLDVNGFLADDDLLSMTPLPVFLDIDPGFNQMWRELGLADVLSGHDAFVTVAQRMGQPDCTIPTCGLSWITSLPPVVLDQWPVVPPRPEGALTTIATWRGPFGPVDYDGKTYGLRVHEFRRFMELPKMTGQRFELALDIDGADHADIEALRTNGWTLVDPTVVSADLGTYQRYIGGSMAEFSVAKSMYVRSGSGWISDRTACYLAMGRPVVVQETRADGVASRDVGMLTYSTLEQARWAVDAVRVGFKEHAAAARAIAVETFDSQRVLAGLLTALGV
ncbi:MAG: hypothetical protein H0V36_06945 [Chloroflexi bacterium]|nr:hypothetical protein [Chloroflexota bacterium]